MIPWFLELSMLNVLLEVHQQDVDIYGSSLDLLSSALLSIPEPIEPPCGSYRAMGCQHRHYINTCRGNMYT